MALHTIITLIVPLQHVSNQISEFKHNTFKLFWVVPVCLQVSRSGWNLEPSVCDQAAILYHSNQGEKGELCHFVLFLPQRNCQWPALRTLSLCLNHPLFYIFLLLILLFVNFSSYCLFFISIHSLYLCPSLTKGGRRREAAYLEFNSTWF